MAAETPTDRVQTLHLAPTLLIGLGGTGKDVLLRVRRLFYEREGKQNGYIGYPIVGYLALDTDSEAFSRIDDEEGLSHFVLENIQLKRGDGREMVDCSVPPNEYTQYFTGGNAQHPHIFRWLLPELNRFGNTAIVGGAGQNRPLGRLAFFHHYRAIRQALEVQLREIVSFATNPNKVGGWLPENAHVEPNRLEIVLVYSLAGGTGAGMFLDMGMLARVVVQELQERGDLPRVEPYFTHFAVLPEPFVQDPRPTARAVVEHERLKKKIQENAFTALREMEYFAMRKSKGQFGLTIPPPARARDNGASTPLYRVKWDRDGREYEIKDCPWDTCYLVGGKNSKTAPDCLLPREIYEMIAEHIFLDFDPSEFGSMKRSSRSNLKEQTLDEMKDAVKDEQGRELYHRYVSRRFSTFGLSQIYFDRERMRRAASYRLARRLVHDWWLRPAEGGLHALAELDIEGGVRGDPLVVTNTHQKGDPMLPLTFDAVCTRLCRIPSAEQKTWWNLTQEEAEQHRRDAEDNKIDPMNGEAVLAGWQRSHEVRLLPTRAQAGTDGMALRAIEQKHEQVLPDVEARVRYLFLYRLQELGVPGCLQLFKEYASRIQVHIHEADEIAARPPEEPMEWKRRLREAQHLMLFARRAARWEILRAIHQIDLYLAHCYQYAAAPAIKSSLEQANGRVADIVKRGSYADLLIRFRDALQIDSSEGILRYLDDRFDELRKADQSRARTIPLMASFESSDYDNDIQTLLSPPGRPKAAIDWPRIERLVLEELRQSPETAREFRDVHSLGDLVLALFKLDNPMPLSKNDAHALARRLAEACEVLLDKFAGDLSALSQFRQEKGNLQENQITKLRRYSSPYLCRSTLVGMADQVDTNLIIYLGISGADTEERRAEFVRTLKSSGQGDHLDNLKPFTMKANSLVLYQEKAGIPLCYDAGLVQLGVCFDKSDRKKETFFDYNALNVRLTEIRLVDQDQHKLLAICLQNALLGVMTGVLACDPSTQRFRLPMRQEGGGTLVIPVGSRLEEVTEKCSQSADVRRELEEQVQAWMRNAERNNPDLLVGLWCAAQHLREEVRIRVQALINQDHSTTTEGHPLLAILGKRIIKDFVLERLRHLAPERLAKLPGGGDLERAPMAWEQYRSAVESFGPQAVSDAWEQWRAQFRDAFRVINDDDLPIPVLLPSPIFHWMGQNGRTT